MNILVTYKSKTGFTKKYAEWISKELSADTKDIKELTKGDIYQYDLIIHGGWIMGGMINGLDIINKLNPKKLIIFGVGYTKKEEVDIPKMIEVNKIQDIPFYYFEGGMNPKKMGFIGRTMVKLVTKKKLEYQDNTNKNNIKELIKKAKEEK